MRSALALAAIAMLGACASVPKYTPPAGNTAYGSYPFRTVVTDATPPLALEGVVVLLPDTVVLTLSNAKCAYQPDSKSASSSIRYFCGDFSFWFSRKNPLRDQMYTVAYEAWEQRQVCITYTNDVRTGAERCSRYGTERVQRRKTTTGLLRFTAR